MKSTRKYFVVTALLLLNMRSAFGMCFFGFVKSLLRKSSYTKNEAELAAERRQLIKQLKLIRLIRENPERIIAFGSSDKKIRLWDMQSNKCLQTLIDSNIPFSLSFSPTNPEILASASSYHINMWDVKIGQRIRTLESPIQITAVAFHPKKNHILAVGTTRGINILYLGAERRISKVQLEKKLISALAFHPENPGILASGSYYGRVEVWDIARLLYYLEKYPSLFLDEDSANIESLSNRVPNEYHTISESNLTMHKSAPAILGDLDTTKNTKEIYSWPSSRRGIFFSLAFSKEDPDLLISKALSRGRVPKKVLTKIYNIKTGEHIDSFEEWVDQITTCVMCKQEDPNIIAYGMRTGVPGPFERITVWKTNQFRGGRCIKALRVPPQCIQSLTFMPNLDRMPFLERKKITEDQEERFEFLWEKLLEQTHIPSVSMTEDKSVVIPRSLLH